MQTGDQILIHIADILHNEFSDQIATYGRLEADNFICCVPKQVMDAGYWKDLLDISFSISGSTYHFILAADYTRLRTAVFRSTKWSIWRVLPWTASKPIT